MYMELAVRMAERSVGLTAPRIEIAFGTDAAVNASEWTDGKCLIEAYFPRSTVTITE